MTLWLVRSGKYGEQEALALEKNLAVVGWDEVPDLSTLKTRADLYRALETAFPDEKGKTLSNWESQLWPFAYTMAEGDLVVMPLKK
jgi:restriction system protein